VAADLVNIDFVPAPVFGEEERGESPRIPKLFGMPYADDAGIVACTSASLAKIMTATVEKYHAFGLTMSKKKTETMVLRPPGKPVRQLMIQAAGKRYATAIVSLELKVKLLRSDILGTLLYGCDTWTLLQEGYDFLRTQHRRLLL